MTDEQNERLKKIREHLAKRKAETRPLPSTELYVAHIDFLLSLIDSQVAGSTTVSTLIGYEAGLKEGQDSMRSACIDAIKSLRAVPRGLAYGNAINDAIHKVESVTIQEQEKQL